MNLDICKKCFEHIRYVKVCGVGTNRVYLAIVGFDEQNNCVYVMPTNGGGYGIFTDVNNVCDCVELKGELMCRVLDSVGNVDEEYNVDKFAEIMGELLSEIEIVNNGCRFYTEQLMDFLNGKNK